MTVRDRVYPLGRTETERARLSQQDRILAPHSENLFRQSGIRDGMRVVDVGCGAGDTTTLLARIVGPTGSVIGVDQDASSLEAAERTVAEAGLSNVDFQQRTLPDVDLCRVRQRLPWSWPDAGPDRRIGSSGLLRRGPDAPPSGAGPQ